MELCSIVLKDGGSGILFSENRNGLGSVALQRFTEGRLSFEDVYTNEVYVEGMGKDLMFIKMSSNKSIKLGISISPSLFS